jgi:UDP-glucose 4-epimerase
MRILVTGGAGFIGSHIVEHFQQKADVRVLDNLRSGYKKNLDSFKVHFIPGSVMEPETLQNAMKDIDFVFHLAAMISVPESMHKPVECVNINTIGTLNVLEAAAQAGVKKLCLSSSAAIYGDNPSVPKLENMLPEPKSPYAETKLSGEYYCDIYTREHGLPTACLRYFNVFGPRQDPASQYAAAIPIFISRAVRNQPITIFGDGEQTRDFIFVKDIVAANAFFATQSACTGIFNVAYGGRITINELAEKIVKLTNSQSEIVHLPEREGDVKHSQASVAKLHQAGFQPSFDFDAGLSSTIEYFSALVKD